MFLTLLPKSATTEATPPGIPSSIRLKNVSPGFSVLKEIYTLLYAYLGGIFCCKCVPATSDPPSTDDIVPRCEDGPTRDETGRSEMSSSDEDARTGRRN